MPIGTLHQRTLAQTSAPAIEPISLEQLKLHTRLSGDDEDTLLRTLIKAARMRCESYTGRSFITQSWELTYDGLPETDYIELPRPDLQSVSSIKYYNTSDTEATWNTTNYIVETGRASRVFLSTGGTWPSSLRGHKSIVVSYTSGYGDTPEEVPEHVCQAIKIIAAHMYKHRDDDLMFQGGRTQERFSAIPTLARQLLNPEVTQWL